MIFKNSQRRNLNGLRLRPKGKTGQVIINLLYCIIGTIAHHSSVVFGDKLYIFGGSSTSNMRD